MAGKTLGQPVQIITDADDLLAALTDVLSWANSVRFAYAWVGSGGGHAPHWKALAPDKIVRSVIGVHFDQTEPAALSALLQAQSEVKIVQDNRGVFHPKCIIGLRDGQAKVLVGSSNFTTGGFSVNTEANIFVTCATSSGVAQELLQFIDTQWQRPDAQSLTESWLAEYRQRHAARPKPQPGPRLPPTPQTLSELAISWSAFLDLIRNQDGRVTQADCELRVFWSDGGSFLQEMEFCQQAFTTWGTLAAMPQTIRERTCGFGRDTKGYFGHMGGAGQFVRMCRVEPQRIDPALRLIPESGPVTAAVAKQAVSSLMDLPGVGIGVATRLLAVKRPDRFFPVNEASKGRIRDITGTPASRPGSYSGLMSKIWSMPWASSPPPSKGTALSVWKARVALLDSVFYEGGGLRAGYWRQGDPNSS